MIQTIYLSASMARFFTSIINSKINEQYLCTDEIMEKQCFLHDFGWGWHIGGLLFSMVAILFYMPLFLRLKKK